MNRYRHAVVAACAAVIGAGVLWCAPLRLVAAADIPSSLTDQEFWDLTEHISEPNGYFQSDNFLSNERGYQVVIPELAKIAKPDRVYLGVGPEQNYPYIIALKPKMAIIFDIRRGNLHEQLLYKALFEMSSDRAEFLSKLWSRKRPEGLTTKSTSRELMTAYDAVQPTEAAFQENFKSVVDWLTKKHSFKLRPATAAGAQDGDADGIEYVYRTAFYTGGPYLTYQMGGGPGGGGGRGGGNMSTYQDIQTLDDGQGVNRGFLANEDNWNVMKDLETRNMLVPVVGDFGGPSAIRSVGKYLKEHNAMVSAFYLSNVEQYLNRDMKEAAFLCNVAALPLDDTSTFIYTGAGRNGNGGGFGGGGRGGGLNTTFLRPMLPDAKSCAGGGPVVEAAPGSNR